MTDGVDMSTTIINLEVTLFPLFQPITWRLWCLDLQHMCRHGDSSDLCHPEAEFDEKWGDSPSLPLREWKDSDEPLDVQMFDEMVNGEVETDAGECANWR
ncbi:unnamed protein product [Hydatigera taeniaeformis]|uniref:C3H1-type domain-containing protein n=1 Tax=Hydatigena taeniaeformis TaxID=6205 RepID=A0A0R3X4G1_HYDTA|nr:unnamed protein product [Hydatigera taeniaeformis]